MRQHCGGNMDGGWYNVVARLTPIYVVVRVRVRQMPDHFVRIHVRRSAAAGLKDIHDELVVMCTGGDIAGGGLNGGSHISRQLIQ